MKSRRHQTGTSLKIFTLMLTLGGAIGMWSLMAVISSLRKVRWDILQLYEYYLQATEQRWSFSLENDLFSILGFGDYLLPFLFLCLFSIFFRSINKKTPLPEN